MTKRLILITAIFLASLAPLGAVAVADKPEAHWHAGDDHGTYQGQPMTAEDCQNLFGGEGW